MRWQGDSVSNKSDSVASQGSVHSTSDISASSIPGAVGAPLGGADGGEIVSFSLRRAVSQAVHVIVNATFKVSHFGRL